MLQLYTAASDNVMYSNSCVPVYCTVGTTAVGVVSNVILLSAGKDEPFLNHDKYILKSGSVIGTVKTIKHCNVNWVPA